MDEHLWILVRVVESGIFVQISTRFVRFFATSIGWFSSVFWGMFDFSIAFLSFSFVSSYTL